ncbi:MAG: hypothetical protein WDA16_05145 [Candidatus Thermoplasmatota archaeon]
MKERVLAFLLLFLLAAQALPMPATACSVPCGRIYPVLLIAAVEGAPKQFDLKQGVTLDVPLTVTYRFDAINDGYSVVPPTDSVKISFEYPRKPAWVDLKVEPETIPVDVNNPTYLTPGPDPNAPTATFSFTAKITVHATLTGQAVLRDGFDYAKLLVFAKSTESGLYQAGYGIKEVRVRPEGAVHESDVAGAKDVFKTEALPALDLKPFEKKFGPTTISVTPPPDAKWWESGSWKVKLSPPPGGNIVLALHDEWGNLEAIHGPLDGNVGEAAFNVTLAKPGLHTLGVTLLPPAGTRTPPVTLPLDILVGESNAEGFVYPKTYIATQTGIVPAPIANSADPTMQWERDVPFFAFDTAQSVSAVVTLLTPGAEAIGRGAANIQFSILDPDGNSLGVSSVDPSKPQFAMRAGSVPQEGWYTLRLRGVGAPTVAAYDARIEVDYAVAPQSRNRADGTADITPTTLARAGRNFTLPLEGLGAWKVSDITPTIDKVSAMTYATTIVDANGTLVYASGQRGGPSSFTPPAPGTYRAFVYAEPASGGVPFAPVVRAFTFSVDALTSVTATTFPLEDAPNAPTSPASESLLAIYAVPFLDPTAKADVTVSGGRAELTDAGGKVVEKATAAGTYYLRVYATNAGPAKTVPMKYSLQFAAPATLVGPQTLSPAKDNGSLVPGFAVAAALLVGGGVAVAIALARRR